VVVAGRSRTSVLIAAVVAVVVMAVVVMAEVGITVEQLMSWGIEVQTGDVAMDVLLSLNVLVVVAVVNLALNANDILADAEESCRHDKKIAEWHVYLPSSLPLAVAMQEIPTCHNSKSTVVVFVVKVDY
jgi:hypothetical protein